MCFVVSCVSFFFLFSPCVCSKDAEFNAAYLCIQQIKKLQGLLKELGFPQTKTILFMDNLPCIKTFIGDNDGDLDFTSDALELHMIREAKQHNVKKNSVFFFASKNQKRGETVEKSLSCTSSSKILAATHLFRRNFYIAFVVRRRRLVVVVVFLYVRGNEMISENEMISNAATSTPPPPPRTTNNGLKNDILRDDSDEKAKYKKALLKKLRWQIVASREKKKKKKKKEEASNNNDEEDVFVEKTLFNLRTRLGISRDSEEVKQCFRVANDLDFVGASKKKKKKKKEKKKSLKRGGEGLEEGITPVSKKQKKKDFIAEDGKATRTFHRLALSTSAKDESNDYDDDDEMMMNKNAERCVRDVNLRVNRFDSFRTCSAQWSLATMCANMVKRRKTVFVVNDNNGFREQSMLLRENLARRFKELAEKADARACATNLWFLAQTSGTMSGEKSESFSASIKAAIKGLRACEEDKISSQDGANALWGIAKLRVKSSLKSEEIESVVAKLAERVVVAAAVAAEMSGSTNSKSNNSKEVSSAMWALATMHVDGIILSGSKSSKSSDGLDATILRVAKVVKKAFQKESKDNAIKTSWSESRVVANCVWSCAKLFANALLTKDTRKVLRETIEIALENENLWQHLEPRAFATLLSAATTIQNASSSSSSFSSLRRRLLLKRALDCFEDTSTHGRDVTPADVCDLCEFIEAFTTTTTTKKKSGEDNKLLEEADFEDRVMKIVTDISKTCDWRASGRLLSSAEALNVDARAKKRLLSSGVEAIKIMELDRFNVDEATAETLSRHIEEQLKSKSTKQRRVLIANCESRSEGKLRQTVEKFGHRFETWQRFSCNDDAENENAPSRNATMRTNARPWPTVSERKCDYAFVRACADKEALLFLMTAVATRVKVGGDVFVSGSRSEGFLNAFDAFNKVRYLFIFVAKLVLSSFVVVVLFSSHLVSAFSIYRRDSCFCFDVGIESFSF